MYRFRMCADQYFENVHGTGGYGYDISKQAINVAKENAKLNDVPAIFERSNLFEDVADETFDVIVSNPPYIRSDEIPFLMPEVSEFEPHEALDGKEDGLFFYRKIIQESPDYLTDGGYLLFEIGYDQGWAVSSMMKEAGFEDVCVKKILREMTVWSADTNTYVKREDRLCLIN